MHTSSAPHLTEDGTACICRLYMLCQIITQQKISNKYSSSNSRTWAKNVRTVKSNQRNKRRRYLARHWSFRWAITSAGTGSDPRRPNDRRQVSGISDRLTLFNSFLALWRSLHQSRRTNIASSSMFNLILAWNCLLRAVLRELKRAKKI